MLFLCMHLSGSSDDFALSLLQGCDSNLLTELTTRSSLTLRSPVPQHSSSYSTDTSWADLALPAVQVAFPYLYNNRPRKVRVSTYHHPMVMYIKMEDPDLPAFYYDPLIHPIAFYKDQATSVEALEDDEEEAFELPEGTLF